jgi:hypothetical protein
MKPWQALLTKALAKVERKNKETLTIASHWDEL